MKIGFIGLGMMGAGMASNLQKAGHQLVVHDLSRQAASRHLTNGATWAESPRAVAEAVDIVFTSLPTPADVEKVGTGEDGLLSGFRKGAAWFDLSTNAVSVVRALHAQFAEQGVDFLDAPVSGGPSGANSGRLAIWVGGDKAVFDKYKPVLDAMGDAARYIGPIGAGSIAKLVHNAAGAAVNIGAGRGIHYGRQGRRRSAAAMGGDPPGRRRPRAAVRSHGQGVSSPAATSRRISRCGCCTRTCRSPASWRAMSACRCGSPTSRIRTDRGAEPRLGQP